MLTASHIKEYFLSKENEHIDINNGLLLCANHDKLFDKHLISFDKEGKIIISDKIPESNYKLLLITSEISIPKKYFNELYMDFHRKNLK